MKFLIEKELLHWGDLDFGKKTDTAHMLGGRHTGHFGTGFYFVSKDKWGDFHYDYNPKRPIYELESSSYNLFKPKSVDEGNTLHDSLKYIDSIKGLVNTTKSSTTLWQEERKLDSNEKIVNFTIKYFGGTEVLDEFTKEINQGRWGKAEDILKQAIREKDEEDAVINNLSKVLSTPKIKMRDLIERAIYKSKQTDNSVGTELMKSLGWEGVDTSHLSDQLDDFIYGSVIYDLKPNTFKRIKEPRQ